MQRGMKLMNRGNQIGHSFFYSAIGNGQQFTVTYTVHACPHNSHMTQTRQHDDIIWLSCQVSIEKPQYTVKKSVFINTQCVILKV